MIGIAVTLAFLLMIASIYFGPSRPNITKLNPYESGMDPVGQARDRYSVTFYMVAMEFIIFDLEIVFLYPWAVQYLELPDGSFWAMIFFIAVLFIGLFYTLKKGTLDWSISKSK